MVSVIIPNYNHYPFLKERIDSVLQQSYSYFEVIILDDCSTDRSREIIENYRNNTKVSNIIYNKKNSGSVFKQWKKGLELAKGDYIWIAESDDFAEPDFLLKMVPILESDKEIGLVYSNSNIIYNYNVKSIRFNTLNDLRYYMFKSKMWNNSFTLDGKIFLRKFLSKKCAINNASAVIFRKSAIDLNLNYEKFKYAGDWLLYFGIALNYKVSFLNETLSNYRDHLTNASKKAYVNNEIIFENFTIFSLYYSYLKKSNIFSLPYIFSIRKYVIPYLIYNKKRTEIFNNLRKINQKLIKIILIFIPIVLIESFFSKLLKIYIKH